MSNFKYQTYKKEILADLYTPVGVYMRVRDVYPQSALMESSDYHDSNNSRSFIGIKPIGSIAISHGVAIATYPNGTINKHEISDEYRTDQAINDFIREFEVTGEGSQYCGLYGYTSFNAVRYFEHIFVKTATTEIYDLSLLVALRSPV